jgi:hypothetical protein
MYMPPSLVDADGPCSIMSCAAAYLADKKIRESNTKDNRLSMVAIFFQM